MPRTATTAYRERKRASPKKVKPTALNKAKRTPGKKAIPTAPKRGTPTAPKKPKRTAAEKGKHTAAKRTTQRSPNRVTLTSEQKTKQTSVAAMQAEIAALRTEVQEARDQQTAIAEVLQLINSSPGDLAPVFDAMLEKAMRLCEAAFGQLATYDGERFHTAATHGVPTAFAEYRRNNPPVYGPGTTPARILEGERVICTDDLKAEMPYDWGEPNRRALVDLGGARSAAIVALRKDDAVFGFIQIYRQDVRPFSDKQVALLENFAAQAVIAMENARLITETREALEQQTATAEVLGVINSSPGDLRPVFDAILEKAHSLCGAEFGGLLTYDGASVWLAAERNLPPAWADIVRGPWLPRHNHPLSRT